MTYALNTRLEIRINQKMKARLRQEAEARQLHVSQLVRLVLAEWLTERSKLNDKKQTSRND